MQAKPFGACCSHSLHFSRRKRFIEQIDRCLFKGAVHADVFCLRSGRLRPKLVASFWELCCYSSFQHSLFRCSSHRDLMFKINNDFQFLIPVEAAGASKEGEKYFNKHFTTKRS